MMDAVEGTEPDGWSELSIDDDESDDEEDKKMKDYLSVYTIQGDDSRCNRLCFINNSVPVEVKIEKVLMEVDSQETTVNETLEPSHAEDTVNESSNQSYRLGNLSRIRFNPYLYVINLSHGQFSWTVRRRYKHFRALYEQIQLHRAKLRLRIPSKGAALERSVYRAEKEKGTRLLPPFPKLPEIAIRRGNVAQRKMMLEKFLQAVVNIKTLRNVPELAKFLEISRLSFLPATGGKQKEGMVKKQSGGRKVGFGCCGWVSTLRGTWQNRWLFVKDTYVGYLRIDTWQIGDLLLMDRDFKVYDDRNAGKRFTLTIVNMCRHLNVHCWTERKKGEWEDAIQKAVQTSGAQFIKQNENDSFAPKRVSVPSRWYIDGASYFDAVANAIEAAKEEIFICDWWLSPEIYLKRHEQDPERWRLDNLLLRKAKEGVRIFVLLYKEIEMTLSINSFHAKSTLNGLHKNIKVLRHPNHVTGRVLIYAHHEKCVVVDQKAAFLGGIDLCFGRWDTPQHLLNDVSMDSELPATVSFPALDSVQITSKDLNASPMEESGFNFPTISEDSVHLEIKDKRDTVDGKVYRSLSEEPNSTSLVSLSTCMTSLTTQQSLPENHKEQAVDCPTEDGLSTSLPTPNLASRLRDNKKLKALTAFKARRGSRAFTAVGMSAFGTEVMRSQGCCQPLDDGQLALNISKPKSRRGANHPDRKGSKLLQWSVAKAAIRFKQYVAVDDEINSPDPTDIALQPVIDVEVTGENNNHKQIWIGKDYVNWIRKDCVDVNKPFEDLVDRKYVPRMPWHDIACSVYGRCARDVARHFIQRWNAAKLEKKTFSCEHPILIPKSYDRSGISRSIHNSCEDCTAQILRSSGRWSAGISRVESSIYSAYINAIENAEHYIYIENQFFISKVEDNDVVENRILDAIIDRIIYMDQNNRTFRVYIVLPLLPAFEGDISNETGAAIRAVMHYQLRTLSRCETSLLKRLSGMIDDPLKYVSIMGLRSYSRFGDRLRSEIIYVHSKLMIVDDKKVIIGSANINDRSMLGSRDSELATMFTDNKYLSSTMNDVQYDAGVFAYNLRVNLMCEHLGLDRRLDEDVVKDPIRDAFYKDIWFTTASRNSSLFYRVFKCYPDNAISTYSALRESCEDEEKLCDTDLETALDITSRIKGHLVIYPLDFLSGEDLRPPLMTKENFVPQYLWT